MERKKIFLCEFHQETNTFNPVTAQLDKFQATRYAQGDEISASLKSKTSAVSGMADAIGAYGAEVLPAVFLHATSGGRVSESVYDLLCERVKYYMEQYGEFDGICVSLHGATCTETREDACGEFLEILRGYAKDRPIAASTDLHANITEKMLRNADVICGYQTYPHVDHYQTGYRAADLCMKILAGAPVVMSAVHIPMMVPPSGYTSLEGTFKEVIDTGKEWVDQNLLLDFTVYQVQPWLDIETIASTVITISEKEEVGREMAEVLAQKLFEGREDYWPSLMTIDEVIDKAENSSAKKPVILVDSADSTNGGAVGDSSVVAMRIKERGSKISAAMFVKDPEAVELAFATGVGNTAEFQIGAKFTPGLPGPFIANGRVRSLHDGYFRNEGPAGKGAAHFVGKAATISFGNVDIMVCGSPSSSGDPQLLRHFGIEPSLYDLVVVKANTSFLVPYGKFAGEVCYADTPGVGAPNLHYFKWEHLPKGFYPYDLPEDYQVADASVYTKRNV